jgi:hypothetical protein
MGPMARASSAKIKVTMVPTLGLYTLLETSWLRDRKKELSIELHYV